MNISEVTSGIYKITDNLPSDILFEGQWKIPNGASVNAYVVKGEKTALIDGMPEWFSAPEKFYGLLKELNVPIEKLDYIIVNHFEPDHSGWIKTLKSMRKDIQIICTKPGSELLEAFYQIPKESARTVGDGDSVDLGGGKKLVFLTVPNVHWPDSMVTYEASTQTLISSDAFGSFGRCGKGEVYPEFDEDLTKELEEKYFEDVSRYYSNIVAIFSQPVVKALEKAASVVGLENIKIIAPSHGIVFRKNVGTIVSIYQRLVACQQDVAEQKVTVLYGSMYGMTASAVDSVVAGLKAEGVKYDLLKLTQADLGTILTSVWTSSGVIIGMPTYEYKMFVPMYQALDEIFKKKMQNRVAFRFGSYGWSGGAQKELDELVEKHKPGWGFLSPVEFKGMPLETDLAKIKLLSQEVAQIVKSRKK